MPKLSELTLTSSAGSGDTLPITQAGASKQITVANLTGTMPLSSTVTVDQYDDLGLPLFPDMWVPVTAVYTATRTAGVWALGSLVTVIGPAGPGYSLVGALRAVPVPRGLDQRNVFHLAVAQGGGLSTVGSVTSAVTGTQAAQAPTQNSPRADRIVTAATAAATAGVQGNAAFCCIGATTDWEPAGFRFSATVRFPDASYDQTGASTGSRLGLGLSSSGTIATVLGADALANAWVGFVRRHVNGGAQDTNWQIAGRDTALTVQDTGVAFAANVWHTFDLAMARGAAAVHWAITNRATGVRTAGLWPTAAANLPPVATMLATFAGIYTVNAVARNIDIGRLSVLV